MTTPKIPAEVFIIIASILVMVPAPYFLENGTLRYLTDAFLLITAAQLWNLLAGFGGIVSVGQHAFVGVGAYGFFGFSVLMGLNPFLAMAFTVPFGIVLSLPIFTLIMRLRTAYFAIGSWVVAEVLLLVSGRLPGFGGGSGLSMTPSIVRVFGARTPERIANVYWLSFAVLAVTVILIVWIMRSRYGLALKSIRDNEQAATAVGVNPIRVKAALFMLSGGLLALVGAINTLQKLRINPAASYSLIDWTVYVIFVVVIGGLGRISGPIIGTVVFIIMRENLSQFGPIYMIMLGALAILVMLLEPGGLAALFERLWIRVMSRKTAPADKI